ncbi:MAG: lipoate--protein ligase family protein [Candidatus Omnitrophica bacterium]|nr:lipoate--protein ligase family protein [Candidatus Omnitrophota bacterium]
MGKEWRFILDGRCSGYYNMAVDEALFCSYNQYKIPTLRIYSWARPFITLGYKQNVADVLKNNKIPFVRRITGGSALLHTSWELTYSLVFSTLDLKLSSSVKDSYKYICKFIINFYSQLNLKADFAKDLFKSNLDTLTNFCLSSFSEYDIIINGKKIGGNAQKRSKNLILQQGIIPLKIDFELIRSTIKDVDNLADKITYLGAYLKADYLNLALLFAKSFSQTFKVELVKDKLDEAEMELTKKLINQKYLDNNWNFYRNFVYEETPLVK